MKLIIRKYGRRSELILPTKKEYANALKTHFGIEIRK
jgi:hypothetical protein